MVVRAQGCLLGQLAGDTLGSLVEFRGATEAPPADYVHQQGWVLTAFRSALWQLLHATNLEEAVVDTVMRGGDTDTKKNRSDP